MTRPFTVSRAEARELKPRSERMRRVGGGIPDEIAHREWLEEMERELRAMARSYDGSARQGRELLEALLIAEAEGVDGVDEIRRDLGEKIRKRRAA
jgi:hypothetical protein